MAKLVMVSGDTPTEFPLKDYNTVGRHPNNTIQILDRIISKEHLEIARREDGVGWSLRDLGSLNGTYILGQRIHEKLLRDKDEITIGSTQLVFHDESEEEKAVDRVTIAPSMMESHIRQRISATSVDNAEFRPEKELGDEVMLRQDYERLRIGHQLARAVGNELDLDTLLQKILDKAFEFLNADRGVILLMDDSGQLVPQVVKHKSGRSEDIVISNSIVDEVVQKKQAVLSSDASIDSRFSGAHSIIMQSIRSTMSVPLLHGNELLGIMNLDSQVAANAFSEKDLRIFTGIATQAAAAIQNARLARKIETEARTRAQFERFFSPAMVQQMVEGKLKLDGVGETRRVTILFADIRGFTAMTENEDATEIVELLNDYFEVMVEVLFKYNGTLDKYVGDELMALFGVPVNYPNSSLSAVECAVEMQKAITEFNRTRIADNQQPVHAGIGINTGDVVYGAIGSSKTLQYTVIGDAVNTASRLCDLARPGDIIISEQTHREVGSFIESERLDNVRVKGKHDELTIYRVRGLTETNPAGLESVDNTRPMS